ncbi:S8 family peptidase [Marinoscillum sp. MHG1-6]|uniref:S8 family peptidase n=1 Tax=Marinoscillum sp. MHG1-6 TaxID=2959627 RepID=UPI002158121D|nr:S8 family peptidase [Marinoscillum sp. MHG1-6]
MRSRLLSLIVITIIGFAAQAQTNRYMVFFADKDTASYSVNEPQVFLSARAIERRTKQQIDISAEDFPVNGVYTDSLMSLGADVYFTTKWMNGALVQMDQSLVSTILGKGFVTKVEYIAPGAILSHTQEEATIPGTFEAPTLTGKTSELQLAKLNAHVMHEDGYRGEGMLIAVLDNGFIGANQFEPFGHIYTEDRLLATKDFVTNSGNVFQLGGHGTQVLSCIGADFGDSIMIGTAPKASYVLCITEASGEYRVEEYNWLIAAEFADSIGVDVINSSLGYSTFDDPTMDYTTNDLDGSTTVVTQAANFAASRGIIVVTSAGNEGTSSWKKITAPGDAFDVLTVGSVNSIGSHTAFSSVGPTVDGRIKPDVCALGDPATVVYADGKINGGGGTSFASPQVAGFAACIWQANPDWSYKTVISAIKNSASNALSPDIELGYGVPNYRIAVVNGTLSYAQLVKSEVKVYPNPFKGNQVTIDFMGAQLNQPLQIEVQNLEGKTIFKQRLTDRNLPDKIDIEFEANESGVYLLSLQGRRLNKLIKLIKI